jgi:quercetin dioxygenase-like cupin family protein
MKRTLAWIAAGLLVCASAIAQDAKKAEHAVFRPAELQWQEAPAMLPKGAKMAVLEGDPTQEGLFTVRMSAPDGYRIPPHWHPAFEHVTVISGTFLIGMGEKWDDSRLEAVPAGGFTYMAPNMRHFAGVKGETVVQVHALGPWALYYVNPADDPRNAAKPK